MKTTLRTYADLENEKLRLQLALTHHGNQIRRDLEDIREELKPIKSALGFLGKFATRDKNNFLLNAGVDIIADVVLRNSLFARAGIITKHVAPFLVKNFSSNILNKAGSNLLQRLSEKVFRFANRLRTKS